MEAALKPQEARADEEGLVEVEPGRAVPDRPFFTDPDRVARYRRMVLERRGGMHPGEA